MGALSPVVTGLSTIVPALKAVDTLVGTVQSMTADPVKEQSRLLRAEQDLALKQLKQKQALEESNLAQKDMLERQKMAADATAAESSRQAALRRAVARQRASFGAQGLGATPSDGSGRAVLLGLFEESEDDLVQREKLDSLRSKALDLGFSQQRGINTLERAQLKERQRLDRIAERY